VPCPGLRFPYASGVLSSGTPRRAAALVLGAFALMLSACSDGSDDGSPDTQPGGAVGAIEAFPSADSKTLSQLRRGVGAGPRMASSVSVLEPGWNRFAFALFDRTRRQIAQTPAAVYVAPEGGGQVEGPYHAEYRSLKVKRKSHTVERDPDAAQSIYVTRIPFKRPGRYQVLGVTQLDQRVVGGEPVLVSVDNRLRPPAVGERAPRVHTPTADSVPDVHMIDTRDPPSDLHGDDLADVLGRKPVMLLFATPRLCRSRVCGPVVDVLEQLKDEQPGRAAYIHMEIWNDNSRAAGERPQVHAYGLPSEPWLFAIDAKGRIAARIEGAFSIEEARAALHKASAR
jgi:hypothetical protein